MRISTPDSVKGYTEVVIASILYRSIGIFIKLVGNIPLGSIIFYRLLSGLTAITLYFALTGKFDEIRLKEKKRYILLLGLFEACAEFSYFYSVRHTTVSIAVLLLYTAPIYVTLLSPLLLRENITFRSFSALILSITGVIIVVQPRSPIVGMDVLGITMGLLSGLLYALIILVSRYLKEYYTGTAQATWSIIVSIMVFLPYSRAISATELTDKLYLLLLFGLIPTALAGLLYFSGLRLIRAQNASIIGLLEPVSAFILAFMLLGEPISFTTILGGGLILLGAYIISRERPIVSAHK